MSGVYSGTITITLIPQANGRFVCEATPSQEVGTGPMMRFHGQTAKHAIANALEGLSHRMRAEVEAEQQVDWDAVDRSPSGAVTNKHFHVILHYERLAEEESKFEAMHSALLGNTVVENAELTIIQVDPNYPKLTWKSRSER